MDSLIGRSLPAEFARSRRASILETVFNQLPDAVFLYDKDLQVVGVNRAAERLLGMRSAEIIGKNCHDLFDCSSWDAGRGIRAAAGSMTGLASGAVNLCLKNGLHRMVMVRTVQVRTSANVVEGVVATIKDVTALPPAKRMIAESQVMRDLLGFVRRVALSEAVSVLIEGENGTGKDLIAKALHSESLRQAGPFLAINCAAIPETLLESELFGYEKGAFTDARAQKRGLFELADKGTLFLDEIAEMPFALQAKLLRALENQTFRRLGGLRDINVDLRIVAATNRNLVEAVKAGQFRQDLYYRLNVIQIVVPPLRERCQDILPLARFFIELYNAKFKQHIGGISPEAENLLLTYHWPGNVRELRNAIERAMILEETAFIRPASLHIAVRADQLPLAAAAAAGAPLPLYDCDGTSMLVQQERRLIVQALETTEGNQTQAARLLRITRDKLRYKMKTFKLT